MNAVQQQNLVGITGITRRLVMDGVLTAEAARKAQDDAASARKSIATFLLNNRLASTAQIAAANAMEFGMPLLDLGAMAGAPEVLKLVSEELIQKHKILPLMKRGNRLFVAITDPVDQAGLNEIKFQVGLSIEPVMVDPAQLLRTYEIWQAASSNDIDAMLGGDDEFGELEVADDIDDAGGEKGIDAKGDDDTPIVKFVNKSLVDAIRRGASDIHFEPYEDTYRVRYRIDGVLRTVSKISHKLHSRIAARLKVMSQLDIAEKRIPQDGRIKLNLSKTKQMDFRVSTLPTLFGEKIVLRLLDGGAAKMGIEKLGYEPDQQQLFMDAIHKPYGMVLVTGPTGSGKTVSLYTALGILNDDSRNISTVEDPVEIRLPGVNQVQQNNKTGMTFAAALRSFLRQDPDIIMVGEIRDLETAEIAVKAAQTGHMVLSTLHTNDGPQTISRLMNMGIAPYNITSSVTLVIAQRLARRLCPACKKEVHVPENALLAEGFTEKDLAEGFKVYEAVGCSECSNGYKGRTGIYQVMPMTEEIQAIVLEGGNAMQIAEAAQRSGVRDLRQSALLKVKQGVTSLAEINRVTKD